jgi:hypothetical protein
MALPWVRLDSNIASHDKILALVADPSSVRWQAFSSYVCSLGWSGGQGTDGYIPTYALQSVHGNAKTARLLVKYGLWDEAIGGFQIRNYATRQELAAVSAGKRAAQQVGAAKGNCIRWHGKDCGCWRNEAHSA